MKVTADDFSECRYFVIFFRSDFKIFLTLVPWQQTKHIVLNEHIVCIFCLHFVYLAFLTFKNT